MELAYCACQISTSGPAPAGRAAASLVDIGKVQDAQQPVIHTAWVLAIVLRRAMQGSCHHSADAAGSPDS